MIDYFGLINIAITLYHECRGEIPRGQVAVAHVILNRMVQRSLPVNEAIFQPYQFSCYNGGKRPPIEDYAAFNACYKSAYTAWYEHLQENTFGGINLYHTVDVHPSWADAYSVAFVERIGAHLFYKE